MADRHTNETALQRTYRAFETLIAEEDAALDLAQAALLIASMEYPDLDMAYYLEQLDVLARRVRMVLALPEPDILPQLPPQIEPLAVIKALNRVLFCEEHFHGNVTDYRNPANSFFNKVLEEHRGIPITLSLLYMEVAKRVGIQIDGVGLPFHFLVRCHLSHGIIYIDPFENGQFLSERDCRELIRQKARGRIKFHAQWFEPVSHKRFLVRMLNNLKHIYLQAEDYTRALSICNLIILLLPDAAMEQRDRGVIHLQLKHYARALHDLTTYIESAPQAEDHDEILDYIKTIRQIMAMMN